LDALGLAWAPPPIVRNAVACAGAATCKLGFCLSRGLLRAAFDRLSSDGLPLDSVGDLRIHINGCPNACGRQPVADIGFYGVARRVHGRLVPHYVVQLGGRTRGPRTRLARGRDAVPARAVPDFLLDLVKAYRASPHFPDFHAFVDANGRCLVSTLAEAHGAAPAFEEAPRYYIDWDAEAPFSLAGRGAGECSAGVVDLIEADLDGARAALRGGPLRRAVVLAARALLITEGIETENEVEALDRFTTHVLNPGLIDASHAGLVERARNGAGADLNATAEEVRAFVASIRDVYDNMDPTLRLSKAGAACCADPSCCSR
jgi:sulfite reductase (ferredoxin)